METPSGETPIGKRLSALGRGFRENRVFAAATVLTLIWLGGVLAYAAGFFGLFESAILARAATALEIALFILAALAPATLFFYGAHLAQQAEEIRRAASRLADSIDALHGREPGTPDRPVPDQAELAAALAAALRAPLEEEKAALAAALARIDAALGPMQEMMARIEGRESAARREGKIAGPPAPADGAQPALPLAGEPKPAEGVRWDSVVRALDFPRDEHDREGFAALRAAVKEREFAELLQAAEDVLTLLAADGLYMEDMTPEAATLEDWVAYARGARGPDIAAVGGLRDEEALTTIRGRMRSDVVFRDSALHFLRRFDRLLGRMARELGSDPMILEAGDSRTGRAFMIIARVTGAFD